MRTDNKVMNSLFKLQTVDIIGDENEDNMNQDGNIL